MTAAITGDRRPGWTPVAHPSRTSTRPGGGHRALRPVTPGSPPTVMPLCPANRAAAFEAVMMLRCTAPIAARRRVTSAQLDHRMVPDASGVLNEFNQPAPAYRLVRLLAVLDIGSRVEARLHGGRHRFQVYRVIVSPSDGPILRRLFDEAWRSGFLLLCRVSDRSLPRWQQHDRRVLAVTAWRAALMAAGRRRSANLALRLADPDTTSVLVNGARIMGVHTQAQARSGCHLLSVPPSSRLNRLCAATDGDTETLEDAV